MARDDILDGFEAPGGAIQSPPVAVSDTVRDRMASIVAAAVLGATPEEISGYLAGEFPVRVAVLLEQPHELDEMRAHVDLLLCVQQAPALATAPG